MVRSFNEREAWAQERAELPAQIAASQRDLDSTTAENTARRERLAWNIRRDQKRMAELDARLARGAQP
jgi:septal ring factor EnvC (AmiA/AmiB activator)